MGDETLSHYSGTGLHFDRAHRYRQKVCDKPHGLWVSVDGDDDWPSWCEGEDFGRERLAYRDVITLTDESRVLRIDNAADLREFDRIYGVPYPHAAAYSAGVDLLRSINWPAVTADYDGIIIAPYQWSCRMDPFWYYGWDVASGCIWNLDAIGHIDYDVENQYRTVEEFARVGQ